jgi:DNA/RNA endonuclease G (NUC1)
MKRSFYLLILSISIVAPGITRAQQIGRPDVCKDCVQDTTGGYISIADTVKINPICNFEVLTAAHLAHKAEDRDTISFFPNKLHALYAKTVFAQGHCIPFEDLAYSPATAKASMNLKRNVAPQPQPENIGTKKACETLCRNLAKKYGSVNVYGGTWGSLGLSNGTNIPAAYWTIVVLPHETQVYWMLTTGQYIKYNDLPHCAISYNALIANLGFDPEKVILR